MSNGEEWHLDKKVPITLIASMMVQAVLIVWFMSAQNTTITNLVKMVEENSLAIDATIEKQQKQGLDSSAMKQELIGISRSLDRLDRGQEKTNELLQKLIPIN